MTYPSGLVAVGVGPETSYGTPVTPTLWIPGSVTPTDNHTPIADRSIRGIPADSYGHRPGPIESQVSLAGPVYADAIGFPLMGVLGDITTSGSGPRTHAISTLNSGRMQPPAFTIDTVDPVGCLQWAGCMFSEVAFTSSVDGDLTYTATAKGLPAASIASPAKTYTGTPKFAAWRGAVLLGGATEANLLAASVHIKRTVTAKRNTNGIRAPYGYIAGAVSVSGSLTIGLTSDTYRTNYTSGTATSVDINYQQGAGASLTQVKLHCSTVTFTKAVRSYGSGKWVEYDIEFVADANTSDAGASGGQSAVKATLQNALTSGSYGVGS